MVSGKWMIRRDMGDVFRSDPVWTEEDYFSRLKQRNVIGYVWRDGEGPLVGHVVYTLTDTAVVLDRIVADVSMLSLITLFMGTKIIPSRRGRVIHTLRDVSAVALDAFLCEGWVIDSPEPLLSLLPAYAVADWMEERGQTTVNLVFTRKIS